MTMDELMLNHEYHQSMSKFKKFADDYSVVKRKTANKLTLQEKFDQCTLRPWQKKILEIVEQPADPRKINWVEDTKGNTGKSFMTDFLSIKHDAVIFTGGREADIAHAYQFEPIVIYDLARSQEENLIAVYKTAECFKNGRIFSSKYSSSMKYFQGVHVFVFANFAPDRSKLSEDRWNVITL
jgi:hypothetical protein